MIYLHGLFQEAENNDNGKAPHSSWRNYDDFNEHFW
jgi:callose synthase